MALNYTDGNSGIFDILGKLFHSIEAANTARGTTVPTAIDGLRDKFALDTATTQAMELAFAPLPNSQLGWQGSGDSLAAQLATIAAGYLRGVVARDAAQPADTIDNALQYLIDQMIADDYYVDPNVVAVSALTADAGNSANDLEILYTSKVGDGENLENLLAEVAAIDLTSVSGGVSVRSRGKQSKSSLAHDWPAGSGHTVQFSAADPAASLLTNGDFEDMTISNLPDNWVLLDGVPGTAYVLTNFEVQEVVIAGTPTSGGYYLRYTSPAGPVYVTTRLAYNAGQAEVQAALRLLPGLSQVTVLTTGTTPNFTHTITFTGEAGNLTTLAAESQLDTGTITPAQVTAGSADAYRGRSLTVVGSGAANRRIYQVLQTLTADKVYFVCLRHKKTATPLTGEVRVALVTGYGGSVLADSAGANNEAIYNLTAGDVTTSYTANWFPVRIRPSQAQPVYLEIDVQGLEAGTTYCLDEVVLIEGTQLYAGGPIVAAVQGKTSPSIGDKWTLTTTNDRAGEFQTYFDRAFDMRAKRLLLPSSGTTNIPDSLIG
jgi:hypothetical protein